MPAAGIDLEAVSQERLMASTRAIAQWTRLSGTPDERAAADWVAAELSAIGYAVRVLSHDAYISLPGPAALRVATPAPRDVSCITHSMGRPSPRDGIASTLVYAGKGEPEDLARARVFGRFALVDGRATPQRAVDATRAGALGLVCISGRIAHEMCCSPVWGNPGESTVGRLPRVILLSVAAADGEALRDLCRTQPVDIFASAAVDTRWTTTPIIEGTLAPGHRDAESTFVMLTGHLDSWYLGAMDNATANATMLEVARLMAEQRGELRRGVRVLFWSGHSHGRYSSSAWYADNFFVELDERCVAHVNADCLGAIDADSFGTNSMPETATLAIDATAQIANAELEARRVGRNSDQSFFGIGIPTILGSVSRQADGALGWWWHTPEDTLDKIDPVRLRRDAKIFVDVTARLLTEPMLPLDYAASAADLKTSLDALASAAGKRFDLTVAIDEAARLEKLCGLLQATLRSTSPTPATARAANAYLQQLGRILIPVTYTEIGRHGHDPALDVPFLPKLQGMRRLGSMPENSDAAKFLIVDLVRARSELTTALRRACGVAEAALSAIAR